MSARYGTTPSGARAPVGPPPAHAFQHPCPPDSDGPRVLPGPGLLPRTASRHGAQGVRTTPSPGRSPPGKGNCGRAVPSTQQVQTRSWTPGLEGAYLAYGHPSPSSTLSTPPEERPNGLSRIRWGGSTPNHPAVLRSGMQMGSDSPGQHDHTNRAHLSDMPRSRKPYETHQKEEVCTLLIHVCSASQPHFIQVSHQA